MNESTIVTIIGTVAIIVVSLVFVYFYFMSLREEIREYWFLVLIKLRIRLDKIPNLIETLRTSTEGQDALINELVSARAETWPIRKAGKDRVHAELGISNKLHEVWKVGKQFEDLKKNTNYLALKMEFKEIGKEIEEMGAIYNNKVRNFNKIVGIVGLKQLLGLMRFKKLPIFEFEP